jgi:hypothetical protein
METHEAIEYMETFLKTMKLTNKVQQKNDPMARFIEEALEKTIMSAKIGMMRGVENE